MALVFDFSVGGANSNSYLSEAKADSLIISDPYETAWATTESERKKQCIVTATLGLDRLFNWEGTPVTATQALHFPANSIVDPYGRSIASDTIPSFAEEATAEYAKIINNDNPFALNELMGIKNLKVGPINITPDFQNKKQLLPESVIMIIQDYGSYAEPSKMRFAQVWRT